MNFVMQASTSSRRAILDRLQTRPVPSNALPEIDPSRMTTFADPVSKFVEMLGMVGGQAHVVDDAEQVAQILGEIEVFAAAKRIASLVPHAVQGNIDLSSIDEPHGLASLDWVIARGEFMVAENGAIWVDGASLPHRVLLFIPQYLALVVSRRQIVHHMHQAYERIGSANRGYGVFVSGPSKTADIEQSLVLGAHGCRTLQVFLLP
jgi:L-lactate dehydrogenase complex protein LldG